jgi:dTDP-glucose 4,6-dehydratase
MEPKQPPDGTLVRRVYEPCSYYPVFRELSEDAELLDCVEPLIGPNLSFHYSKINMKPPAIGSVVEWHQDLLYYPLTNSDSLAALLYLDSADRSNGCLQVIPGGHLAPPLDHTRNGFFQGRVTEPVDMSKALALEGDAGTVIFLHCLTPHSSVTNTSNRPRRTLILSYRAADTFPLYTGEMTAAAESHVEKSILDGASEFVTTNVEGTQILLDAIREDPVERFVLISSSEVYGTAESEPMDEEHPLNPRSPYAATKAGADRLAYSYYVTYGLPIVILRPFNNYGPYQHPEKVVPRFVTQALADLPLTVHGDGHASRDWLYVEDHAEAIDAVLAADISDVAGEVLNVATGADISVSRIADLVLEQLGKPASLKVHVAERAGQVDRHIGSTEKAERLLGWRARTSFEAGLERTIAWYEQNRHWWEAAARAEPTASGSAS